MSTEEEMTNEVVDASSPPDTHEGVVMNDSPANTTTTDNSDATNIPATKEEDTPSNDNNISNNNAPYTNDKELLGEPTTTIDGTPQPQPQIEEAPSSPIKQLINKFNQSQQSNNNNDSIQSSAPAVADVADKVEKEEDVENLTEDEYDQLDNDHDDAMDVVIEEEEIEEEIEEGIVKDAVVVEEEECETADNSIVHTVVQEEDTDLQDLDANNEDLTAGNNEEEEIKVAVAEVEDTEEVIKDDFVENTNVQEEAELSPLTQTDTETLVAAEGVEDSKTTEIMPVPMEMTSYTNGEAVVTNNTAAASSPVIIEEATPLARSSPTNDNENEIRSEFIRSIFIKRMQESSSNDQLEKQQQTNNGVNYCNGNNNIESQPPSPTEMHSAGSQSSEVWYDNNLDNDAQQQQHRCKKYKTVFGGFDKCLVVKIVLGLILVMGIVLGTRGNGSSDNNNVDENGNTSNLSELDSVNVDQETGETSVSSTTVSPVDTSISTTMTEDEEQISSPALTLLIPATEVPTSKPTLQPSSFQSTSPSLSVSPTYRPTPKPTLPPTNPFTFYSFIAEDFLRDERSNEASGAELSPDGTHLIVVSDNGKVFFLNLLDYKSGHCMVDLDKNDDIDDMTDFEGVAIDHNDWSPNNMQAYIVHEGSKDEEPYLFKIKYTYDATLGTCSIDVIDSTSLYWALPCLTDSNGIESLTWKEGTTNPAQFYAGLQDTGKLYEVSSDGTGNGRCHDGGLGIDDLSASSYDGRYLWSFYGETGKIVVIDPERNDCTLATYDMPSEYDKEGLTIDKEHGLAYVAVDETGGNNPSLVAVHNFTYPTNLETATCIKSGSSMRVCPALCKEPI